ncbi:Os02g0792100, partial [Oryza sativa Japonica Group]
ELFLQILHLSKNAGPELLVFQVRKFRSDERNFPKCYPEVPVF